jgi:membrane protein implicated in regulation of membrane protease activity
MVAAGLVVMIGAFLHSLLSGWEAWAVVCLAAGAIAAFLGCPHVRRKLGPQSGRKRSVYDFAWLSWFWQHLP